MMIVLWAVRGLFTREVLYNPACSIGLGLCLGLFIALQAARPDADDAKRSTPKLATPDPPAAPGLKHR
jgi:hypothetical protein